MYFGTERESIYNISNTTRTQILHIYSSLVRVGFLYIYKAMHIWYEHEGMDSTKFLCLAYGFIRVQQGHTSCIMDSINVDV